MGFIKMFRDWDDGPEGGSMFGPKMGSWSIHSSKDRRWNQSGRGYGFVSAGGPGEMSTWIEECRLRYGPPPDDLTTSFYKD